MFLCIFYFYGYAKIKIKRRGWLNVKLLCKNWPYCYASGFE